MESGLPDILSSMVTTSKFVIYTLIDQKGNLLNFLYRYTEMEIGNLNILISVPHDGNLKPNTISDRLSDQNGNFKNDQNTRTYAKILKEELVSLFLLKKNLDAAPFVIYNNLHR